MAKNLVACFYGPQCRLVVISATLDRWLSITLGSTRLQVDHLSIHRRDRSRAAVVSSRVELNLGDIEGFPHRRRRFHSCWSTSFPSIRQHLFSGACPKEKTEHYHKCYVLHCVTQLYTHSYTGSSYTWTRVG